MKLVRGIFGSKVWAYVTKETRKKLDKKSKQGIFVGYCDNVKGYRVYYEEENKVAIEREIIFTSENVVEKYIHLGQKGEDSGEENNTDENIKEYENVGSNSSKEGKSEGKLERERNLRPKDVLKVPQHLQNDYDLGFFSVDVDEPQNYEEAMQSRYAGRWKEAIDEEIKALIENETWQLVEKPGKNEIIDSKWIFKVKKDQQGKINKFKCRLVVRGFKQNVLEDVYSPVVRLTTVKTILAVCAHKGWLIYQMDVCNAFLHGELHEDVYMSLPEGFETKSGKSVN